MQILTLFLILSTSIAAIQEETDLFSQNLDINLFDDAIAEPTNDFRIEGSNPLDSSTGPDKNWLLNDNNVGLNSITGSNSNLFLASNVDSDSAGGLDSSLPLDTLDWDFIPESGSISLGSDASLTSLLSFSDANSLLRDDIWNDINSPLADKDVGCEVSNLDDISLLGKKRRGATCAEPETGESDSRPKKNTGPDPYVPGPIPWGDSTSHGGYAFPEKFEICPTEIFKKSNTPICKEQEPAPDQCYFQLGQSWMHLYDVSPRTLVHDLELFRRLLQ